MSTAPWMSERIEAFEAAMTEARVRLDADEAAAAFAALERAHVLGQIDFGRHLRVHVRMLRVAWTSGNRREVRGQLLRIALVPIGHLAGRLPTGNTGGANVSAFKPMPIPPDLRRLMEERRQ
jgi:hypothetical protein